MVEDSSGESGRGLLVVRGLSQRFGARGDARGRVVWADIAWNGPPPHQAPSDGGTEAGDAAALTSRFGVPVWTGQFTGQWWALARGELVPATTAPELAATLARLLAPPPPPSGWPGRHEPRPPTDTTADWAGGTGGSQC